MSEAQPAASAGRRGVAAKRAPDDTDRRLINAIQGEFPLSERPFAEVGAGTMNGVRVLFIGSAADSERVKAVVEPTGSEYVFIDNAA